MKLTGISASRVSTFDQCLFKYFLTYHLKEALKSNFGATNGSIIHAILERYAEGIDKDWVAQLIRGYSGTFTITNNFGQVENLTSPLIYAKDKEYRDIKPHCYACPYARNNACQISGRSLDNLAGCPKQLFEESLAMTKAAIDRYKDAFESKFISSEEKIQFNIPGCPVPITSILDLILRRNEDTIEVVDYKTGKWTKTYEECREDLQVRLASLAARDKFITNGEKNGFSGIKHIVITFDYFTEHPVTLAFSETEDRETEDIVRKKFLEIKNTKLVTRVIGNKDFNWKCKAMCDPAVCQKLWRRPILLDDNDEVIDAKSG